MHPALEIAFRLGAAEGSPQGDVEAEAEGNDGVQETPEGGVPVREDGGGGGGSAGRAGGVGEGVETGTESSARWEGEAAAVGTAEHGHEHAEHGILSGVGAGAGHGVCAAAGLGGGLVRAEHQLAELSFGHVRAGDGARGAGAGNPLGGLRGVEVRRDRDVNLGGVGVALSRGGGF